MGESLTRRATPKRGAGAAAHRAVEEGAKVVRGERLEREFRASSAVTRPAEAEPPRIVRPEDSTIAGPAADPVAAPCASSPLVTEPDSVAQLLSAIGLDP